MKNIIYFIVNEEYLKLFKYSYYSIRKVDEKIPILCIVPKGFKQLNSLDVLIFEQEDFDYRYSSKYSIINWPQFDSYDDYLYLDCDTIILKNLNTIFDEIKKDDSKIHATKEHESINEGENYHNFNKTIFEKDTFCVNAGVFGFNKKLKQELKNFLNFIEENKKKAIHDQPLFNIYFYGKIKDSLNNHVEMFEYWKPFDPKIVHLFGSPYEKMSKMKIYKRFYRQETRGDILKLMPKESTVGLFNCSNEFIKGPVEHIKKSKKLEIQKDLYDTVDNYYDLIYIDSASNINELIEMIRKLYPKVKKGGIISSALGNEEVNKIAKIFIEKSNLDFFMCFDDAAFFTIKL